MKNLKEILSDVDESLLDDEDTILQDTKDKFLLSQAEKYGKNIRQIIRDVMDMVEN